MVRYIYKVLLFLKHIFWSVISLIMSLPDLEVNVGSIFVLTVCVIFFLQNKVYRAMFYHTIWYYKYAVSFLKMLLLFYSTITSEKQSLWSCKQITNKTHWQQSFFQSFSVQCLFFLAHFSLFFVGPCEVWFFFLAILSWSPASCLDADTGEWWLPFNPAVWLLVKCLSLKLQTQRYFFFCQHLSNQNCIE